MDPAIAGLLRREVSALVFDQYGTIVDMEGGLTAAVTPFFAGKGRIGHPHHIGTGQRGCLGANHQPARTMWSVMPGGSRARVLAFEAARGFRCRCRSRRAAARSLRV